MVAVSPGFLMQVQGLRPGRFSNRPPRPFDEALPGEFVAGMTTMQWLSTLFSVVLMTSCASIHSSWQGNDRLYVSLKRPGEFVPTKVSIMGSDWEVTLPNGRSADGRLQSPSVFWDSIRTHDLARLNGSHVDPYSPDYQWELRAVIEQADQVEGSGTHFGAKGDLFDIWNGLASLLERMIATDIDLNVSRSLYEQESEAIIPPWDRYNLLKQP